MKVSLQNLDISDVFPTSAGPAVTRVTWGPGEAGAWQPRYTDIWQGASLLSGIIIQSFFWQLTLDNVLINVGHGIKMSILPFHHFVKITSEQLIEVTSYMTCVAVFVISRVCSPASYSRLSRSHTDTRHILDSHWSMGAVTWSASANQRQGETLIEFRKT